MFVNGGIGCVETDQAMCSQVCIGDIKEDMGKATAAEFTSTYPGCVMFVRCDVTSDEDVKSEFYLLFSLYSMEL